MIADNSTTSTSVDQLITVQDNVEPFTQTIETLDSGHALPRR